MFTIFLGPKSVSPGEAHNLLQKEGTVLLDVREDEEVAQMRVPGSRAIPIGRLDVEADQLKEYSNICVMCRSGVRSKKATKLLQKKGFKQAVNVKGGIMAWKEAGFPTT